MSIQKDVWVKCDKCGESGFASHTADQARAEARRHGWVNQGGIDLCSVCAPTMRGSDLLSTLAKSKRLVQSANRTR